MRESTVSGHNNIDTIGGGHPRRAARRRSRTRRSRTTSAGTSGGSRPTGSSTISLHRRSPRTARRRAWSPTARAASTETTPGRSPWTARSSPATRLSGTRSTADFDAASGPEPEPRERPDVRARPASRGSTRQLAPTGRQRRADTDPRPLPGSPALDAAAAGCGLAADQRGVPRPGASTGCDLGAFEGTVPRPVVEPHVIGGPPVCKSAKSARSGCRKCPRPRRARRRRKKKRCGKRGKKKKRRAAAALGASRYRPLRGRAQHRRPPARRSRRRARGAGGGRHPR